MSGDYSTCPGPDGNPIPLVHFTNAGGPGMLAVSFTDTAVLFTTPAHPFDATVNPVLLSWDDRQELGRLLLEGLIGEAGRG